MPFSPELVPAPHLAGYALSAYNPGRANGPDGPTRSKEHPMDEITREPTVIRAEDINPRYNWGRALPALGTMGVDFEERVDYRRLHRYRLGARQAGAGEVRPRRAPGVRRQQHPLHHLDQDRRMGARQALPLGAAHAHQRRSDPVGLRLGRRASQALCALAQAGELQGRPDRPARHRRRRRSA